MGRFPPVGTRHPLGIILAMNEKEQYVCHYYLILVGYRVAC